MAKDKDLSRFPYLEAPHESFPFCAPLLSQPLHQAVPHHLLPLWLWSLLHASTSTRCLGHQAASRFSTLIPVHLGAETHKLGIMPNRVWPAVHERVACSAWTRGLQCMNAWPAVHERVACGTPKQGIQHTHTHARTSSWGHAQVSSKLQCSQTWDDLLHGIRMAGMRCIRSTRVATLTAT